MIGFMIGLVQGYYKICSFRIVINAALSCCII